MRVNLFQKLYDFIWISSKNLFIKSVNLRKKLFSDRNIQTYRRLYSLIFKVNSYRQLTMLDIKLCFALIKFLLLLVM